MKYLKVNLWGREIGRLVWDVATRRTYFVYNPDEGQSIPDIAPLAAPATQRNVHVAIYGDDRPIYQGLPPFIADSLPDSWGNALFDRWVKDNKIPRSKVTPLYKLMFIGSRGMGALEYEPCAMDLTHTRSVDVKSLHDLSLKIIDERKTLALSPNEELTLQALLAVGTSAGGRQLKAIIAIDNETGEIRSGQTDGLEGYDYYILKFGDKSMPIAEIEAAYYQMAVASGIEMEDSRLLAVDGVNHFLTRRFDRRSGHKVHVQTLAAMNPEARSYEDLVSTARQLSLPESEVEQLYARMVFNVMANNTDDHNKNFSFILEEGGSWHISPAYDMTFIFNQIGTGPNVERRLSIGGKTSEITLSDLLDFAAQNHVSDAQTIINRVAGAIGQFNEYAQRYDIKQPWRAIIAKTLRENLKSYGFLKDESETEDEFYDNYGRSVQGFAITVNSKAHFEVVATIEGRQNRRFVRPNMSIYQEIAEGDISNLPKNVKLQLIETLFPN